MRWGSAGTRLVLWAVLIVGLAGLFGPAGSTATFTDAHDGEGSITAVDSFGGGGPPGGGVTADAGGPYSVEPGGWVWLSAADSTTSRGNIQSYEWEVLAGPGGGSFYQFEPVALFNAPSNVQTPTEAVVQVAVTTSQGLTATDTASITIAGSNGASATAASPNSEPTFSSRGRGTPQEFGNVSG